MSAQPRIAVIGGGVAAYRAAERLRERGFTGALTVVGGEPWPAYRRPALSDELLRGRGGFDAVRLRGALPARTRWLTSTRAMEIDFARGIVVTDQRGDVLFDRLIVATGLAPQRLPLFDDPAFAGRVHYPTTYDATLALRDAARRAERLLVVGAGLVGTEVAASLARRGTRVTLVDAAPTVLAAVADSDVGDALTALHRRHGVDVRLGVSLASAEPTATGVRVGVAGGESLEVDHVVVAIGSRPELEWAASALPAGPEGVHCEPTLHVSGREDVVACGDCAAWPNLRFGGVRRRVEQWTNATRMARHAADTLLDGAAHARPYTPVSWGWTEQWGVRVHMVGEPHAAGTVAHDAGTPAALDGMRAWRDPLGRVVGGLVLDRPWATLDLARQIERDCPAPSNSVPLPVTRTRWARQAVRPSAAQAV